MDGSDGLVEVGLAVACRTLKVLVAEFHGMDRRAFLAAATSTTLVAVAGCSGDGNGDGGGDSAGNDSSGNQSAGNDSSGNETGGDATTASDSGAQISVGASSFDPLRQSVEPGTEVVWTNDSSAAHTVDTRAFHESAEEWSINSSTLDPGDSVSHTFEESGVYEYFCAVHGESNMCGAVLVGDASLDEDLPCEGSAAAGGQGGGGSGNETGGGNETAGGNETGGNDSGGSGNETSGSDTSGNETAGNESSGNESA